MTPLAQQFFRQLNAAPAELVAVLDEPGIRNMLEDLHCFECSAIQEPILAALAPHDGWQDMLRSAQDVGRRAFLPSPRTWIEWFDNREHRRVAILCERQESGMLALWRIGGEEKLGSYIAATFAGLVGTTHASNDSWKVAVPAALPDTLSESSRLIWLAAEIFLTLDLINTPGMVKLRKRDPHKGFAREMNRKFPGYRLEAWHEVRIDPAALPLAEEDIDAPLGARRCLHFVRSHRRHLADRETIVSAHWRGDPALGIKQTRYRLE